MHIVKVGNAYVTAAGTLSSHQSDALRIYDDSTIAPIRLVAFKPRGTSSHPTGPVLTEDDGPYFAKF